MGLANSVDEWVAMARQHEASARQLVRPGAPVIARAHVLYHVGCSVEFALKALIMRREGLNRWPDRSASDYWTHDLNKLLRKLGIVIQPTDPVAPAWSVVVTWTRIADYTQLPSLNPFAVAKSYIQFR